MRRILRVTAAGAVAFWSMSASAAFITTNEAAMDAVYQQPALNIDIVFNAPVTVFAPALLSIDNAAEMAALWGLVAVPANTVSMYFVDLINWCGVVDAGFIGCGELPGDDLVVESLWAAGAFGGELNSHELGHNLGLSHLEPPPLNLMNPNVNGDTTLTAGQQAVVALSPLVQNIAGQDTIFITPIVITPEPGTLALLASGLFGLAWRSRRR